MVVLLTRQKTRRPADLAGLFSIANTSMAGSLIYILVFGNLFSLCFVWVAVTSVENALDKFSTGAISTGRAEVRDQRSEIRGQRSDDREQRSGGQGSGANLRGIGDRKTATVAMGTNSGSRETSGRVLKVAGQNSLK